MTIFDAIANFNAGEVEQIVKTKPLEALLREDGTGFTPLMKVALHQKPGKWSDAEYAALCASIVKTLCNAGVPKDRELELLNGIDFLAGRTALHWACEKANLTFYKAFHQCTGLETYWYFRDFSGKTPVGIAREKHFYNLMVQMEKDRAKRVGKGESVLAIIGMGPAGTALFIRLVKRLIWTQKKYGKEIAANCQFQLFDKAKTLAQGTPYSLDRNSPTSLLNVAAGGMSIDADNPFDFVEWVKQLELSGELEGRLGIAADLGLCPPSARVNGYYPRTFYGEYLRERLEHWIAAARKVGIQVDEFPEAEITSVKEEGANKRQYKLQIKGGDAISATQIFYTTGHFEPAPPTDQTLPYLKSKNAIVLPASADKYTSIFNKPTKVAVIGSSLSAIDAIFAILLNKKAGSLTWQGDIPTYVPVKDKAKGDICKVICYSRKGLFSKVRPESNEDLELHHLNPRAVERFKNSLGGGKLSLDEVLKRLEAEFQEHDASNKEGDNLEKLMYPFKKSELQERDPFAYLDGDIEWADGGDKKTPDKEYVRWYQLMHALFPVMRGLYRDFSKEDRLRFDKDYNSNFLWAFAPMPLRSARILSAMHKAGALELYRVAADPIVRDGKFVIVGLDSSNAKQTDSFEFLCHTAGLATRFHEDPSELTNSSVKDDAFVFEDPYVQSPSDGKEASAWIADDGTFEIAERIKGELVRSAGRRGVGFFLRAQLFDGQAVPSVVKYGAQVAELYYDEFIHRLGKSVVTNGDLGSSQGRPGN